MNFMKKGMFEEHVLVITFMEIVVIFAEVLQNKSFWKKQSVINFFAPKVYGYKFVTITGIRHNAVNQAT